VTPGQQAFLAVAGFAAGGVNGMAGGGSLVSFPALLAVGQPALAANVTSAVGIWPGYLGGVLGFRSEVSSQTDRVRSLLPATLAGGVAGAVLLLTTPSAAFTALAPFLILGACGLFAAQPALAARLEAQAGHTEGESGGRPRAAAQVFTFLAAVYGAYFGAGLGVVLLAVLGILLPDRLARTNGLRGVLSLVTNTVAALIFIAVAPVAWEAVACMAGASLVGGYTGARVSRRIPTALLRGLVITTGLVAAGRLLI